MAGGMNDFLKIAYGNYHGTLEMQVSRAANGKPLFGMVNKESAKLADRIGTARISDVPTTAVGCNITDPQDAPEDMRGCYIQGSEFPSHVRTQKDLYALIYNFCIAVCKPILDIHAQYEAFNRYVCNHASLVAAEIKVVTDIGHIRGNPVFIAFLAYGDARTTIEFRPEGNRNLDRLGPMINGFAANTELAAGRLALSR